MSNLSKRIAIILILTFLFSTFADCKEPVVYADSTETIVYTVKEKDFLIRLGKLYFKNPGSWRKVAMMNNINPPYWIYPDQRLIIPVSLLKGKPISAEVEIATGDVKVKRRETDIWQVLKEKDLLFYGDSAKTGKDGRLVVKYSDGTVLQLAPKSIMSVKLALQTDENTAFRQFMIKAGKIINHVSKRFGRKNIFTVIAGTAVMGVRGTTFRVKQAKDGIVYAEVLKGRVAANAEGQGRIISAGQGTRIVPGKAPEKPKKLLAPPVLGAMPDHYRSIQPLIIEFMPVAGATAYHFEMATDPAFLDIVLAKKIKSGAAIDLTKLAAGDYYLRLSSVDEWGLEGPYSPGFKIFLDTSRLPAPKITLKKWMGKKNRSLWVAWSKVDGAVSYTFEIARDADFKEIIETKSGLSDNIISIEKEKLPHDTTVFFRVRADESDVLAGSWSETEGLDIKNPAE